MNRIVVTMMAPLVSPATAPDPLAPATMLPLLTNTQGFPKWILKVCDILHAKRWNGITAQHTKSPAYESLSSEIYMLLINCLDGDMIEPYIQGSLLCQSRPPHIVRPDLHTSVLIKCWTCLGVHSVSPSSHAAD
jgi:hypothetical protein